MSVQFDGGSIQLVGVCPVEDAETLLSLLLDHPGAAVELSGCGAIHTAIFQVLLAIRPPLLGLPSDTFFRNLLYPLLIVSLPEQAPTF